MYLCKKEILKVIYKPHPNNLNVNYEKYVNSAKNKDLVKDDPKDLLTLKKLINNYSTLLEVVK